ncbi:MAG TPA: hypothetical protein VH740_21990 [Vicinamibacterales bacterium]
MRRSRSPSASERARLRYAWRSAPRAQTSAASSFRRGMAIVSVGIAAGVTACVIAGPFLAHLLYGVSP